MRDTPKETVRAALRRSSYAVDGSGDDRLLSSARVSRSRSTDGLCLDARQLAAVRNISYMWCVP